MALVFGKESRVVVETKVIWSPGGEANGHHGFIHVSLIKTIGRT